MRTTGLVLVAAVFLGFGCGVGEAQTGAKAAYPEMAPLEQYLIADEAAEVALARSAAPESISGEADVMVLRRDGYATVARGKNGFTCLVERSWGTATDDREFWNPKMRAPHCFNAAAMRTFAQIYLMKTKLALTGMSPKQIHTAVNASLDGKALPAVEPGAMAYMMSKQQYLNDEGNSWHPHVMFFVAGDAVKSWGADATGSPVMAANDPEERVTILFVLAEKWSDGTAGPAVKE